MPSGPASTISPSLRAAHVSWCPALAETPYAAHPGFSIRRIAKYHCLKTAIQAKHRDAACHRTPAAVTPPEYNVENYCFSMIRKAHPARRARSSLAPLRSPCRSRHPVLRYVFVLCVCSRACMDACHCVCVCVACARARARLCVCGCACVRISVCMTLSVPVRHRIVSALLWPFAENKLMHASTHTRLDGGPRGGLRQPFVVIEQLLPDNVHV